MESHENNENDLEFFSNVNNGEIEINNHSIKHNKQIANNVKTMNNTIK